MGDLTRDLTRLTRGTCDVKRGPGATRRISRLITALISTVRWSISFPPPCGALRPSDTYNHHRAFGGLNERRDEDGVMITRFTRTCRAADYRLVGLTSRQLTIDHHELPYRYL